MLQSRSFTPSSDFYYLEPLADSDPYHFGISILVAETGQKIQLVASKKSTVDDVIKFIYSLSTEKLLNGKRLAYKSAEGYELRLVDEGKPIYEMSSLNGMKQLGDYDLDVAAFCPKKKLTPSPFRKTTDISLKRKSEKLGMTVLKVHVNAGKEKTTLIVQSDPEQSLEKIFDKIALKRALVRKRKLYKFLEHFSSMDYSESMQTLLRYNDPLNTKEIDMKVPVKSLRASELVLVERFFPDVPEGSLKRILPPVYNADLEWEGEMHLECADVLGNNGNDCDYNVGFGRER
eukprot:TRINITY_DN7968_c0_g1_i2.p1 TRINITY_DN7968_c0_g1~~TRINITY_DN7968_c0_g1_i2.p1  ORF type:complete len:289 (-),score=92.44 TRINITY_DN7968_c0_g1_i2:544-1410(-)